MAEFERIMIPNKSALPKFPSGLESYGLSGKGQYRSTSQRGRTWEEEYPGKKWDNPDLRAFIAYINSLFSERTVFTINYYHLSAPLGAMNGGGVINGGSQTGSAITVTACTTASPSQTIALYRGDLIRLPGINHLFDVKANVLKDATSISVSPPIITGGSPTNGQAITYTGVKFQSVIDELSMPIADKSLVYKGLKIKFRETP